MGENATEGGAGRFEKTAPDARAAPPRGSRVAHWPEAVEEVPLTGLSSSGERRGAFSSIVQRSLCFYYVSSTGIDPLEFVCDRPIADGAMM